MAYLVSVPSERSTGEQVRRSGIAKAGNPRARRVLPKVPGPIVSGSPEVDLCRRPSPRSCGRLRCGCVHAIAVEMPAGKRQSLVTTAIAREMAAFLWAIGHEVERGVVT